MNTDDKIANLRIAMKKNSVDAYIVPSDDPHLSKFVSSHWKSRQYFSGFTGTAGTLVVTQSESGLWTDGRYYIQATNELEGSEVVLYKSGEKGVPTYIEYLAKCLNEKETVGIDGRLFSTSTVQVMKKIFDRKNIKLRTTVDLVAPLWRDRPEEKLSLVYVHELCYCGLSVKEKLQQVREMMIEKGVEGYVISDLASIAWLFNIRAEDIEYNPMAIAYAYVSTEKAYLCIDGSRVPISVSLQLKFQGVEVKKYEAIEQILSAINKPTKVLCYVANLSYHLYHLLDRNAVVKIIEDHEDIIIPLKAIKNPVEIENIKKAHIKDGCALVHFMLAFEQSFAEREVLTEYEVGVLLREARLRQENNKGESFASIIAYKENAAMMHYVPTKEQYKILQKEGFLLIDSGGQYLEGTTDITRTFALGPVTEEEKLHYTLVLKSHINMAKAIFMKGCTGGNLDILAREPIWAYGLDYKCGTGHGVGFMSGVHEGPQSLRMSNQVPLQKGMIITNEPGIYIKKSHGIRTENILLVKDYKKTEDGEFYQFETITYFPIDTKPIKKELLNDEEIKWLNTYHEMVYEKLSKHLQKKALEWLKTHTMPI